MAENKKLSDESLNLVSGGTFRETLGDSRFLHFLLEGRPSQPQIYGEFRMLMENHTAEIKKAWASVGVDATLFTGNLREGDAGPANIYKINGKTVSREDAMEHAKQVIGRGPIPHWD